MPKSLAVTKGEGMEKGIQYIDTIVVHMLSYAIIYGEAYFVERN